MFWRTVPYPSFDAKSVPLTRFIPWFMLRLWLVYIIWKWSTPLETTKPRETYNTVPFVGSGNDSSKQNIHSTKERDGQWVLLIDWIKLVMKYRVYEGVLKLSNQISKISTSQYKVKKWGHFVNSNCFCVACIHASLPEFCCSVDCSCFSQHLY